ncbi:MAG: hypothetical protein K8R35_06570 [Bacteroidales bacterium]|nr:hypothetical protein [Bacteroidales bacterium]
MIKILSVSLLLIFAATNINGQDWDKIFMYDVLGYHSVSSELDAVDPYEGLGRYGAHNLFDSDTATAWVEGADGPGIGEYLLLGAGSSLPDVIKIDNGYQKSEKIFLSNNRVGKIAITLYAGFSLPTEVTDLGVNFYTREAGERIIVSLADTMGSQDILLPYSRDEVLQKMKSNLSGFVDLHAEEIANIKKMCPTCSDKPEMQYIVKIEILDVYKGTRWDDTCISGISFIAAKEKAQVLDEDEVIVDVYDDMDAEVIYIDTDRREKIILADSKLIHKAENLDDETFVSAILMDVSSDKRWAQIDYLYGTKERSRVMEMSYLYNVRKMMRIDPDITGVLYGMYGFTEKDGKIYLDSSKGLIDLEKILQEINR